MSRREGRRAGSRDVGRAALGSLIWLLVWVGAVLAAAGLWIRAAFGVVSVDQLQMNLIGAETGGAAIVWRGVIWVGVVPTLVVGVLIVLVHLSRRSLRDASLLGAGAPRVSRVIAGVLACALPIAALSVGGALFGGAVQVRDYARSVASGLDLGDYAVAPELEGGEPRNLILVYLESVEDAMADDTRFEEDMLAPVSAATADWERLDALTQAPGGGWTMAGVVATQCGIPLRSATAATGSQILNQVGEQPGRYLPGATCLGDVLQEQGYRNVFLGGADATFAAKERFLREHGYDEVRDLRTWRDQGEPESAMRDWGLGDRRLLELAADEAAELHRSGDPFNLTVLTLDTHEPAVAPEGCDMNTREPMTAITRCSMTEVAGFVEALDAEGILDDTAVVVMGDHLKQVASWASFHDELGPLADADASLAPGQTPERTIFNRVWNPEPLAFAREQIDQLSLYPTLIELAGLRLTDHRAGLGVSAFASEIPDGSALALDADAYDALLRSRSADFYRDLWSG
ncbi:hypothetical protein GCM10009847_03130 [Leucobacter tardus]|uniref:Sulfatase-like hydrolase/transferase n=1 Tax=Leucobacter tardus TaxID=501483 RepID=A0A939QII0_9MICO|nr:sulfatase-like hydrolase/transferase [Leucobacter tardus]MBO2988521.1 sulfatase-like hydrolase/transferase [Leucobacter tardus]